MTTKAEFKRQIDALEKYIGHPTRGGYNHFGYDPYQEKATGLYAQLEDSNERFKLLCQFLKVDFVDEVTTTKFKGFRKREEIETIGDFMVAQSKVMMNAKVPKKHPVKKAAKKVAKK